MKLRRTEKHPKSHRRERVGIALIVVLLALVGALEVTVGPVPIPLSKIIPDTLAYLRGSSSPDAVVMGAIRWPRACVAGLVGAGLASTGAALQAVFRNPMADPGIIGVSSGGSLGAVTVISLGLAGVNQWFIPLGAFAAGLATTMVVYWLGTIGGRTAVHSLLLSGVAVSAFCSAVTTFILSLSPMQTMQQMLFWLMGGLDGSTWMHVFIVFVFVGIALVVYPSQSLALDILTLGEEQAEGVGVNLNHVKRLILSVAALTVGACVSVSGVIAFVGLIVPHLMRLWIGPGHRLLIPASAVGGALLVIGSDVVARTVLSPSELNIGVVTSCLGAPFFLYLLRRQYAQAWRR